MQFIGLKLQQKLFLSDQIDFLLKKLAFYLANKVNRD
jgi:hypothetical protein